METIIKDTKWIFHNAEEMAEMFMTELRDVRKWSKDFNAFKSTTIAITYFEYIYSDKDKNCKYFEELKKEYKEEFIKYLKQNIFFPCKYETKIDDSGMGYTHFINKLITVDKVDLTEKEQTAILNCIDKYKEYKDSMLLEKVQFLNNPQQYAIEITIKEPKKWYKRFILLSADIGLCENMELYKQYTLTELGINKD